MSILAEKLSAPPTPKREPSKIEKILDSLPGEDASAVQAALQDRKISAEWLAKTLADEGHAVSPSTIRSYRRSSL